MGGSLTPGLFQTNVLEQILQLPVPSSLKRRDMFLHFEHMGGFTMLSHRLSEIHQFELSSIEEMTAQYII